MYAVVFFFGKLFFVIFFSAIVFGLLYRSKKERMSYCIPSIDFLPDMTQMNLQERSRVFLLLLCMATAFLLVALVSYFSWPTGDEWLLMTRGEFGLMERLKVAVSNYSGWCSRLPEIIGTVGGLDRTCWQDWVITPFFVMFAPFAVWRFVQTFATELKNQKISLSFYLLVISCFLLISPYYYAEYWVNVTYIWTSVPAVYLAAIMFDTHEEGSNLWKFVGCYLLGLYCGWGTETQAQALLLISFACLIRTYIRNRQINLFQFACCLGIWSGAFMVLSSSAMEARAATTSTLLSDMTSEEVVRYVTNLDWEKVTALRGAAALANLVDVPLFLRWFFIPYGLSVYASVAIVPLLLLGVLVLLSVWNRQWKDIAVCCMLVFVSVEMVMAYVAGALPMYPAYIPPAVVLICACAYLYSRVRIHRFFRYVLSFMLFAVVILEYIPDIWIASSYKQWDKEVDVAVAQQSLSGQKHIILPKIPPLPHTFSPVGALNSLVGGSKKIFSYEGPLKRINLEEMTSEETLRNMWNRRNATRYFKKWYDIESIVREK